MVTTMEPVSTSHATRLNVLDLFAGLRGWSDKWRAAGHNVLTLDYEAEFGSDLIMDILAFAEDAQRFIDEAAQRRAGTAAAVRAEAPLALSTSFAVACEDPTPPRTVLEAWQ